MKTLILGIGNLLLTDEGIGVRVVEALRQVFRDDADVELLDGGTLSFTLAVPIQDADALIVVDAAQIDAAPGSLRIFEADEMDRFLMVGRKASVHEVSLVDLLVIAKLAGHWPGHRALVAIQPASLEWGEAPTEAVAAAIPEVCRRIVSLVEEWRHAQ